MRSFASPKQLPALLSCLVRFSCASWSPEAKLPIRACALLRGAFSRQMKMNAGNQRQESEKLLKTAGFMQTGILLQVFPNSDRIAVERVRRLSEIPYPINRETWNFTPETEKCLTGYFRNRKGGMKQK